MAKQFAQASISLILLACILCSYGQASIFNLNWNSNLPDDETSLNSEEEVFFNLFADVNDEMPDRFPIPFLPGEEFDPEEEKEDNKRKSHQGVYAYTEQVKFQFKARPIRAIPLSIQELHRSPLYLLLEVFRI